MIWVELWFCLSYNFSVLSMGSFFLYSVYIYKVESTQRKGFEFSPDSALFHSHGLSIEKDRDLTNVNKTR